MVVANVRTGKPPPWGVGEGYGWYCEVMIASILSSIFSSILNFQYQFNALSAHVQYFLVP
jgi:hypothetical protein